MAEVRRQEFVVSLADLAANPTKVLAANEFLYVRQVDGKLKMMCGDGVTAISALPYTIDIGAMEQAVIDAQTAQGAAEEALAELVTNVVNNLTDGGVDVPLSAEMGKELDGKITNLATNAATATDGQILASNGDGTSTFIGANSDLIEPGTRNKYYTDELAEGIKGTTQSITFNADGTVQKIQHKNASNVVLREDVFTYSANLITEVRTLSTLETITYKHHTDTLVTEVI